jgi:hypothetical protein
MGLFGAGKPDHPMAERKDAARILAELPAQDLKALEELAHWHESAGTVPGFKAEERAQRLAMIDEAAQPRVRKLGRDYLAATRAKTRSRVQENLVWSRIHAYWRQAAQAQGHCIDAILQGGKAAEKSLAPTMAAALRALAQQLKWQQLHYTPVDPAVWGLANRIFALAESRGIAEATPEFLKAALFSAASPESLLAPDAELAERLIAELAAGFVLSKAAAPDLPYWIDLGRAMAPARSAQAPQPAAGVRYFGAGAALARLGQLIEATQAKGQAPAELKLGAQVDPETLLAVMRHLALYWAPTPRERRHKRHSVTSNLKVTHGFDGVLEALGGESASLNFGQIDTDSWEVENVSAGGFGARALQAKSDWLKVGALLAAQPEGAGWMVATVRRVSKVSPQELRIGVETLSRAPKLSDFTMRNAGPAQGVILPPPVPVPSADASIALRAGAYVRGENLEAKVDGQQHVFLPQGVAARGDDYEIVRFKEMVKES